MHRIGDTVVSLLCKGQSLLKTRVGLVDPDRRAGGPEERPVEVLTESENRAQQNGQGQPLD